MPFVLVFIGLLLLVAGVRGTHTQLFTLIKGDFTGSGNFIYWIVAILAVGAVGYIKPIKPVSDAFLVLIIIVMVLSNKGLFGKFTQQIQSTNTATPDSSNLGTITPLNPIGLGQGGLFGGNGASGNY